MKTDLYLQSSISDKETFSNLAYLYPLCSVQFDQSVFGGELIRPASYRRASYRCNPSELQQSNDS